MQVILIRGPTYSGHYDTGAERRCARNERHDHADELKVFGDAFRRVELARLTCMEAEALPRNRDE